MTKRLGSCGAAVGFALAVTTLLSLGPASAADSLVGKWRTIDDKSGKLKTQTWLKGT